MRWSGALALAVVAAVVLTGCGGGGSSGSPSPSPSPSGPTPAPTPPPPTPAPLPENDFCGQEAALKTAAPPPPTPAPLPENDFCGQEAALKTAAPAPGQPIGWNPTGASFGGSNWCATQGPGKGWNLKDYCGGGEASSRSLLSPRGDANVKVLTYNLYWWNLFIQRKGDNGMAGKNMAAFGKDVPYDLIGFQECEDVAWPLRDAKAAGLSPAYTTIIGRHATAIAYRTDAFDQHETGQDDVAEDVPGKFHYGRRIAQWVRLTHKASGKKIFFMNHHGPTSPNTGGLCGNRATAYNIVKVIATNARVGDAIIMVGDFNAPMMMPTGPNASAVRNCSAVDAGCAWCEEAGYLDCHLPHSFANPVIDDGWGIDNFYSTCTNIVESTVMPKGGSDHNAINTVFELTNPTAAATVTV